LSAAVTTADGRVTVGERQVQASLLGQWGVTQTMVAHAILRDHLH